MTAALIETCADCGKTWGVSTAPRDQVLCTGCSSTPRLPEGEVRVSPKGVTAVCLGGDRYLRWKVIGVDPDAIGLHGWRADRHVADWRRLGNVGDLNAPKD